MAPIDQNAVQTVNLTMQEVNTVLAGLGELPAKISYDLINNIRDQVTAQNKPKE